MTKQITKSQHRYMRNVFIQFFKFFYLNVRIMRIVAGGHGGTRP
jgi:hypothetical protein